MSNLLKLKPVAPLPGTLAAKSAAARAEGQRVRCADTDDRKKSIEDAMLRVITKNGIAAVTLANVAAAAGCSTGLLGKYCGGSATMKITAVNLLAADKGDSAELRKVFSDGFNIKAKGLKLPKGFKL